MTWQEGEFEELGAELRRRVGAEFEDEAAELERLAVIQRKRRGSIADAAQASMHGGDRVTFVTAAGSWSGHLVMVGADYAALVSGELIIEAHLLSITLLTEPSRSGGKSGVPASSTWRARLAEIEMNKERVSIFIGQDERVGFISVVAADYLEFVSDEEHWVLPLSAVTFFIRPRPV